MRFASTSAVVVASALATRAYAPACLAMPHLNGLTLLTAQTESAWTARRRLRMAANSPEQPAKPVVFLDLDGVINRTHMATHIRVDEDLVERARQIIVGADANVVLSTFWRHFREYITYVLHRYGIDAERVIGVTPGRSEASMLGHSAADDAEYVNRAAEIGAWLDAHPQVTRFVVLDDRPSASDARLAPNFVHTKSTVGLTDEDVRQALKILQG